MASRWLPEASNSLQAPLLTTAALVSWWYSWLFLKQAATTSLVVYGHKGTRHTCNSLWGWTSKFIEPTEHQIHILRTLKQSSKTQSPRSFIWVMNFKIPPRIELTASNFKTDLQTPWAIWSDTYVCLRAFEPLDKFILRTEYTSMRRWRFWP